MHPYRFSLAAAWALGGLGWLLVGLAVAQFVATVFAAPNPLFQAAGIGLKLGAALDAGKVLAMGLSLAVLGGVARAVLDAAVRFRA